MFKMISKLEYILNYIGEFIKDFPSAVITTIIIGLIIIFIKLKYFNLIGKYFNDISLINNLHLRDFSFKNNKMGLSNPKYYGLRLISFDKFGMYFVIDETDSSKNIITHNINRFTIPCYIIKRTFYINILYQIIRYELSYKLSTQKTEKFKLKLSDNIVEIIEIETNKL